MDETYAREYRDLYQRHWWWRARQHEVLAELGRVSLGKRPRILDVGCGDGLLFDRLQEFGDVEGVEIDPTTLTHDGRWRERIHVAPFNRDFQPGRKYDVVLMLDVLEHMQDPREAVRCALRLLAPGGRLLITVPAFRLLWTTHDQLNHHHTRYTRRELHDLTSRVGGEVRRLRYLFHWLFFAKLAVRAKEALLRPQPAPPRVPAKIVNTALYALTRCEQALSRRLRLPFGGSLLAAVSQGDCTETDSVVGHSESSTLPMQSHS